MKSFAIYSMIFVAVISLAFLGLGFLPADVGYSLIAEFEEVPPSDLALEEWMKSHKGVYAAHVNRERIDNLWVIKVIGGRIRNGRGEPPFPKIESSQCVELGYRGGSGRFRHNPE